MSENRAETIKRLIASLSSDDPVARQKARDELVQLRGEDVTRALVRELIHPKQHVRWEAAKALTPIADPVAAPGLMNALDDEDPDVRWLAGEGLIALRKDGLLIVLDGLTKRAGSVHYRDGAHHVLSELRKHGFEETVTPVLQAIESPEPGVTAPPEAHKVLVASSSWEV